MTVGTRKARFRLTSSLKAVASAISEYPLFFIGDPSFLKPRSSWPGPFALPYLAVPQYGPPQRIVYLLPRVRSAAFNNRPSHRHHENRHAITHRLPRSRTAPHAFSLPSWHLLPSRNVPGTADRPANHPAPTFTTPTENLDTLRSPNKGVFEHVEPTS